jgi:SAM-dependent methyltransferase
VYEWYRPWLPGTGDLLDWGCRHAPDSCLIAADPTNRIQIAGCDTVEPGTYDVFHRAAGLTYTRLGHDYELPYESAAFDAVVASGVLEHVPFEHESVRELARVTRLGGVLVISFLPNRWSWHELRARRATLESHAPGQAHHLRTYRLAAVRNMLQATGFVVVAAGYQTHFDLLPLEPDPTVKRQVLSSVGGTLGLGRVAPCLALVARRLDYF